MKKRFFSLISAAIIAVSTLLSGCSEYEKKVDGKLSIVTTCFPPYDFARAVTGGDTDITMLLCPGAEAHSYEPTPLDIATIRQCDVFIYIGGEGEVWADKILDTIDTEDMTVIRLFDFVEPLGEEHVEGASPNGHSHHHHHEHEHEEEHEDELSVEHEETDEHNADEHNDVSYSGYDEHIWTSPENAELCVKGISDALCTADSSSAELYKDNTEKYTEQIHKLGEDFAEMTENAPENVIVIGDRFPFRYLTNEYGIEYFAAFSGCSSESEPGVYTMAFLIDEILAHDIDTVFYLEFSTKRLAEKLCDATGAKMLPLHSCNNVSNEDFENGITYIDLMKENLNNLREALY